VGKGICLRYGIYVCNNTGNGVMCPATEGPSSPEQCNGLDDDCDGTVDNGLTGDLCPNQNGVCFGSKKICGGTSGWLECSNINYGQYYESIEVTCDGLDNDCDNSVDEGLIGQLCPLKTGVCAGSREICENGSWQPCSGQESYGSSYELVETTCDYLDNDCDSATDDDWVKNGKYYKDEACGNCYTDCTQILNMPQAYGVCESGGDPVCVMKCDPGYIDLNNVITDGCEFYLDPLAIYVSVSDATSQDAAGCGLSPEFACKSIGYGINRAVADKKIKVLVADGTYNENIQIVQGIDLLGGYRPDTWERNVYAYMTIIKGNSTLLHKKTITAQSIKKATTFEGFVVYGQHNFDPQGNSYVFYISDSTDALKILNNFIIGASGGLAVGGKKGNDGITGGDGQKGENTIETFVNIYNQCIALSNVPGNKGLPGDPGTNTCGGLPVNGGNGAGATCPSGNKQEPQGAAGLSAGVGHGTAGAGGAGGYDRYTTNCGTFYTGGYSATASPGADGTGGGNGTGGSGCSSLNASGKVVSGEWMGNDGITGLNGSHGGGGGGGGAGGGADVSYDCSGTDDCLGGSGGGGGAGGCGAYGGNGGGYGAGSFCIFIFNSSLQTSLPAISGNTFLRGYGGDGGDGGAGGTGGLGGKGGKRGEVAGHWAFAMGQGGAGGAGGNGGHGGGGGGGCGGISNSIYAYGTGTLVPDYQNQNNFLGGGEGGVGGQGGFSLSGNNGQDGSAGATTDVLLIP
jgi:hypothetical protein